MDTDGHLGTSPVSQWQEGENTQSSGRPAPSELRRIQKTARDDRGIGSHGCVSRATVKDQAAQIEKVRAQLELQKPALRVVVNRQ